MAAVSLAGRGVFSATPGSELAIRLYAVTEAGVKEKPIGSSSKISLSCDASAAITGRLTKRAGKSTVFCRPRSNDDTRSPDPPEASLRAVMPAKSAKITRKMATNVGVFLYLLT